MPDAAPRIDIQPGLTRALGLSAGLALACVLAACGNLPSRPPAAAAEASASGLLRGQILLPRELEAPPRGALQLQLVARFNPSPSALASTRIAFDAPPPWPFELRFDRAAVADPTLYRLDVALFDEQDHLRLVSDGEHPVNLDEEAEPTRIELIALDHRDPEVSELDCAGQTVTLRFAEPELVLSLDAVPYRLRRAHSARGRRYLGADAELWLQQDEARLQLGERQLSCQRLP